MIDKQTLEDCIRQFLEDTDVELIRLTIDSNQHIEVLLDSFTGVDIDCCTRLTRFLQQQFLSLLDEYDLEVGSVSITDPFLTPMQYKKNVGHEVEITGLDGKKVRGLLVDADDDTFLVDVEQMVAVEGKKRKQKQIVSIEYHYGDVKSVRYDFKF